jgi:pimeloyl-ACP methyl ester carboxylesterase
VKIHTLSLAFAVVVSALNLKPARAADHDVSIPVTLRTDVTTNVVVTIRENPRDLPCIGRTLVTVPGMAHTAATWNPLIDQLFGSRGNRLVCRVAAIDLPGHGKSGLPKGALYGSLTIDDYVTAVAGALDGLNARFIRPHAIIGHSMGGLIVEALQAKLLAEGSSLAKRYAICLATVMSPGASREQPWTFADSGIGAQAIMPFIVDDPTEGPVLHPDAASWDSFFFTNLAQQLSPYTPTPEVVMAKGYMSDESLSASAQLEGVPPWQRMSVGKAPFAIRHRTILLYINPSQDLISLRPEAQAAYVQLTADPSLRGFLAVDDDFAVHDMFIAQPALLLQKIGDALWANL